MKSRKKSLTAASLYNFPLFWCPLFTLILHLSLTNSPTSFAFQTTIGAKIRIGTKRRKVDKMGLPSTVGLSALRSVGRRSKRLMSINQRGTSADAILSLSATRSNDESQTPSHKANAAVPVTPSPRKAKKSAAKKQISAGRKRKRSSTFASDTPISRKLELDEEVPDENGFEAMIENNDLELTTDMVAAINTSQEFIDLDVRPEELRPSKTLTTGQCFHWRVVHPVRKTEESASSDSTSISAWGTHDATEWVGTLRLRLFQSNESVVLVIRELPDTTLYRLLATTRRIDYSETTQQEEMEELHRAILDYFQLDVGMSDLYKKWSQACPRLARIAECIPGVRIVRQDPWECLVSFICSSNNNIPRITKMLNSIRREYGQPLLQIPSKTKSAAETKGREYYQLYSFPSLEELASHATDEDLRGKCGMGYRASYILETMKILSGEEKGGEDYLRRVLRNTKDPIEVQTMLCEFKGVGRKVADCVALFSLDQEDAIPVDTHVWNIAIRDYDPEGTLKTNVKSLTPSNYKMVGDLFRSKFPNKAGWAHSLLFVAELPSFKALLPKDLVDEMETFQKEEKERKKQQKENKKKAT